MKTIISPNSIHPGEIINDFYLKPLKLTIENAAKKIGISKGNLSAIVNGKASITTSIAGKLAKAFKTTSHYWLNMQGNYNSTKRSRIIPISIENAKAKREKVERIHRVIHLLSRKTKQ